MNKALNKPLSKEHLLLLIVALLSFKTALHAQQPELPSVEKGQMVANFISPSVGYEARLARKTSLALKTGLGFGIFYESNDGGNVDFGLWPYLMADYRYYYNLDKRAKKGQKTTQNSGNFIGLSTLFVGPFLTPQTIDADYGWSAGPVWGIQRTYWNRLNLKVSAGMGVFKVAGEQIVPWPIIDYSLGIRLGK